MGIIDRLYDYFRQGLGGHISLDPYIEKVRRRENLSFEEATKVMHLIMENKASDFQKGALLTALTIKGETVEEIAAFAETVRNLAEKVEVDSGIGALGDTCGTGGGTQTFNVSTTIMFILASAGIKIAKHGNRAVTSKCGSADVLEELGVKIDLDAKQVGRCISEIGIGFIFAPNFHKAFKNVQKVRRELGGEKGIQTVFNILGPLANPAFTSNNGITATQVLGVSRPELTNKMAEVLRRLNIKRAVVVHGYVDNSEKGMDELSIVGKTKVSELKEDETIEDYSLEPEQLGLKRANLKDLLGGDRKENASVLVNILRGEDKGPRRDFVLLNAAAGLYVGGKVKSIKEGIEIAAKEIDNLGAYKKLQQLIRLSKDISK